MCSVTVFQLPSAVWIEAYAVWNRCLTVVYILLLCCSEHYEHDVGSHVKRLEIINTKLADKLRQKYSTLWNVETRFITECFPLFLNKVSLIKFSRIKATKFFPFFSLRLHPEKIPTLARWLRVTHFALTRSLSYSIFRSFFLIIFTLSLSLYLPFSLHLRLMFWFTRAHRSIPTHNRPIKIPKRPIFYVSWLNRALRFYSYNSFELQPIGND